MRIACISTSQVPSTTANSIQVMKVCQEMQIAGHKVHLWIPGKNPVLFTDIQSHYGLHEPFELDWVPTWDWMKRYDFSWSAVTAALNWKPDLVYTWTPQAALLSVWKKQATILEMHDRATGKIGPRILQEFITSRGESKELVCVTRALRQALENQLAISIPDDMVVIAPNGVDTERYENMPDRKNIRMQLGLDDTITASYTGHFYAGRGMDVLFSLAKAYPDVQFLWIGGRERELEGVKNQLAHESLSNVRLTGFIDNQTLPLYQAASDILLMPYERSIAGSSGGNSADICSPMKMFEYMAAGRAILSSDLAVIREVLDERSAWFCLPEDSESWVKTFGYAIAHMDKAEQKGLEARTRLAGYTIQKRQQRILRKFSG